MSGATVEVLAIGRAMSSRALAEYLAEFMPTNGKPGAPCALCGDRVFYRFGEMAETPWICRSCHPPSYTGWRICQCRHEPPQHVRSAIFRWFVVSGIGR